MAGIFKFKQFDVNQSGCAMKVNTDGVLLGALAEAVDPQRILDVGTGTGVIALMLAQRFKNAQIDAVEIDAAAAETAGGNFEASPFAERMNIYAIGFEEFLSVYLNKKFDLIVSNPPFFLNSLTSPGEKKNLARHTDSAFFERLITAIAAHLTPEGVCAMILPLETVALVNALLAESNLHLQSKIIVKSFAHSEPHREIITFGKQQIYFQKSELVIYDEPKVYSADYQFALCDFLTIF